jgi:hypothetical protein
MGTASCSKSALDLQLSAKTLQEIYSSVTLTGNMLLIIAGSVAAFF